MSRRLINTVSVCAGIFLIAFLCRMELFASESDEESTNGSVTFSGGLLSLNAKEVRSEDLMKEIGEKCGVKIVVFGEVFSEVPVSLKFQKHPLRKGIERVMRAMNISNFLMHFEDGDNGSNIVELDLIGKKGGERHLTEGSYQKPKTRRPNLKNNSIKKRKKTKNLKNRPNKKEAAKIQENFLNIMDEILNAQLGDGEEPDPSEILRLFKEVVPPEMKDQIPPEVLEELEKLE